MFASLNGKIDDISNDHLIIDVNGVGYLVFASTNTLNNLKQDEQVKLHIETHIREDHIHLFGFIDSNERAYFNMLSTVQGVGNKVALAILSSLSIEEITTAILNQDNVYFTKAKGVGARLAARITTELKGKIAKLELSHPIEITNQNIDNSLLQDCISALINLGFNKNSSHKIVTDIIAKNKDYDLGQIISEALRELG